MRKQVFSLVNMLVVASFVLVPLIAVGCAPEAVPTPPEATYKPETWTFYMTGDYSGPMGPINAAHIPWSIDFCNWTNERGGIRGVPIACVARDNASDLASGIAAYDYFRTLEPKPVIGSFHPAFVAEALRERLEEDEIVDFMNTPSNSTVFPVSYLIAAAPSYVGCMATTIEYARDNWKGGDIKLGLLTWDNAFGKAIFDDEFRKWCAEQEGIELVAEEVFQPTDTDVSTQIIKMKEKGVNWVFDNTNGHGPVVISKSIDSLGLLAQDINDTTPGKMHRATDVWGMDESSVRLGGGPGGILEGLIGIRSGASWSETDNPSVQMIKQIADENNRGPELRNVSYMLKWGKWYFVTSLVGELVDEYGWEGVTGKNLRDKMLNTSEFNALDVASFGYTPECPYTMVGKIYQVQNGELLPITGILHMPDLRPAEYR